MLQTVVLIFTSCWYYTSSKVAIASQTIAQEHNNHNNNDGDDSNSSFDHSSLCSMMMALTALQLLSGLFICWPLHGIIVLTKEKRKTTQEMQQQQQSSNIFLLLLEKKLFKDETKSVIVGILHFLGCLSTNMGFAYGSASVVQVIKLLEPIETLLLAALVNVLILQKTSHGITCSKALSVVTIVFGTSLLLTTSKKGWGGGTTKHVNPYSVAFALFSGICMALRNVVKKSIHSNLKTEDEVKSSEEATCWKQSAIDGMVEFSTITVVAAIPASILLVTSEIIGGNNNIKWMMQSVGGIEAILFHGMYNIASISVLCLVSAQSHSLLNVGKRIFNVLSAAIIFQEPIGPNGIIGLCVAAMGGVIYSSGISVKNLRLPTRQVAAVSAVGIRKTAIVLVSCAVFFAVQFRFIGSLSSFDYRVTSNDKAVTTHEVMVTPFNAYNGAADHRPCKTTVIIRRKAGELKWTDQPFRELKVDAIANSTTLLNDDMLCLQVGSTVGVVVLSTSTSDSAGGDEFTLGSNAAENVLRVLKRDMLERIDDLNFEIVDRKSVINRQIN